MHIENKQKIPIRMDILFPSFFIKSVNDGTRFIARGRLHFFEEDSYSAKY